jgi:hypothetical protein
VLKIQVDKLLRLCPWLGKDQFQFVPVAKYEFRSGFWAHTDPVDARWWELCSIGLNRNRKTILMQAGDEGDIELQERLTSSAHNEWLLAKSVSRRGTG